MGVFTMPEVGITGETTNFLDPTNQGMMAAVCQDMGVLVNSLVVCMFMVDGGEWTLTEVKDLFNALTGWDYSVEELLRAGERGFTVQRLINLRDGHSAATDVLPKKMFKAAVEGARAGKVPPLEDMRADLYRHRGWDESGSPTAQTLERLGLSS
jgi:aldehyde:ferredoxin oxidoreductase